MKKILINGEFELLLPDHRADRPQWLIENGGWEVERIKEMVETIMPHHVVFDIGTEEGDISALIQKYTNCKMVLVEPNDLVWPCIKAIWEANNLEKPIEFFSGFFCNESIWSSVITHWNQIFGSMNPDHGFRALTDMEPDIPRIKIDDWCKKTGVYPDVITMDVEGSEFEVIRGAEKTLREKKPIIFMSVHPEFMYESYRNDGKWKEMYGERQHVVHMLRFIDELGYTHRCIEYDYHELHMRFDPK